MERHRVESFRKLYYDFKSAIENASRHNAIDVFRAIKFYRKNLSKAGMGLSYVTKFEQIIIYTFATYATF